MDDQAGRKLVGCSGRSAYSPFLIPNSRYQQNLAIQIQRLFDKKCLNRLEKPKIFIHFLMVAVLVQLKGGGYPESACVELSTENVDKPVHYELSMALEVTFS